MDINQNCTAAIYNQYSNCKLSANYSNKAHEEIIKCYDMLLSRMPNELKSIQQQIEHILTNIDTHQAVINDLKK